MKIKFFLLLLCFCITTVILSSCNSKSESESDNKQREISGNIPPETDLKDTEEDIIDEKRSELNEGSEYSKEKEKKDSQEQGLAENPHEVEFDPDPKYGKEIYNNTCASCHGISGTGDGVASAGLNPKPRDLSNSEYLSSLSNEHLFKTISDGGASVGLSALMPPWKGILTDQQIRDVISHIRNNICKCIHDLKENSEE